MEWRPGGIGSAAVQIILPLRAHSGPSSDLDAGRFRFLNTDGDLGSPPDWSAPGQSQLWRYHLHYFDVLSESPLGAPIPALLIDDWIARNPFDGTGATRDAWHPYVVSLRMVNWMLALSAVDAGQAFPKLRSSLVEHAVFLERNLETDVGGNHLLKNLKAMTFAGCFWNGATADRWRREFSRAFADEAARQVLADGGHYELSPMYHCQVLGDVLETAAVLQARGEDQSARTLRSLAARMLRFLDLVTHPDGGVALFNDSVLEHAPAAPALANAATALFEGRHQQSDAPSVDLALAARASGYVPLPVHRSDRRLIADVGRVCPEDLPAHGHADLLSFEVSVDGLRMIANAGVGQYAAGPQRDYYRSTRAHNTVEIDRSEQSDCWGSFRVGRRAHPLNVTYTSDGSYASLRAEHDGYDHLSGRPRHARRFTWRGDEDCWFVEDELRGDDAHEWASFCHVHPDAAIDICASDWARVSRQGAVLDICWFGFDRARIAIGESDPLQGWSAERFSAAVAAPVLILEANRTLPANFGYALVPQASANAPRPALIVDSGRIVGVQRGQGT